MDRDKKVYPRYFKPTLEDIGHLYFGDVLYRVQYCFNGKVYIVYADGYKGTSNWSIKLIEKIFEEIPAAEAALL